MEKVKRKKIQTTHKEQKKLIDLVRPYGYLYDPKNPYYHKEIKRTNAWIKISKEMNKSAHLCEKIWLALKTKYISQNDTENIDWKLHDHMHDILKDRIDITKERKSLLIKSINKGNKFRSINKASSTTRKRLSTSTNSPGAVIRRTLARKTKKELSASWNEKFYQRLSRKYSVNHSAPKVETKASTSTNEFMSAEEMIDAGTKLIKMGLSSLDKDNYWFSYDRVLEELSSFERNF